MVSTAVCDIYTKTAPQKIPIHSLNNARTLLNVSICRRNKADRFHEFAVLPQEGYTSPALYLSPGPRYSDSGPSGSQQPPVYTRGAAGILSCLVRFTKMLLRFAASFCILF